MSDVFAYLRWRFAIGLTMLAVSAMAVALATKGVGPREGQPTEAEVEQARQAQKDYLAEREIRRARDTDGYDPSDPSVVRDGYSSGGSETYPVNPSE